MDPGHSLRTGLTLDKVLEKNRRENEAPRDLDQWTVELSKAQSLEDISDMLAETLFGNQELQQISDQIVANRPAANSVATSEPAHVAAPVEQAPRPSPSRPCTASNVAEIVLSVMPDAPEKPQGGPEPIEAQIDTAITQSRLALSSADLARLAAEDKQSSASSGDST